METKLGAELRRLIDLLDAAIKNVDANKKVELVSLKEHIELTIVLLGL